MMRNRTHSITIFIGVLALIMFSYQNCGSPRTVVEGEASVTSLWDKDLEETGFDKISANFSDSENFSPSFNLGVVYETDTSNLNRRKKIELSCEVFGPDKAYVYTPYSHWVLKMMETGLTRRQHQLIARELSYGGPFGLGKEIQYLQQNPQFQRDFTRYVWEFANIRNSKGQTRAQFQKSARSRGYVGPFGCGGFSCFESGVCDKYGRLPKSAQNTSPSLTSGGGNTSQGESNSENESSRRSLFLQEKGVQYNPTVLDEESIKSDLICENMNPTTYFRYTGYVKYLLKVIQGEKRQLLGEGLTYRQRMLVASRIGYNIENPDYKGFGAGQLEKWIQADQSGERMGQFIDEIRAFVRQMDIRQFSLVRDQGYEGPFLCGNYECYVRGECDRFGRPYRSGQGLSR